MTMIASYDWTSDTWTHHNGENPARNAFRQAVDEVAQKAREALPEANGRVDKAVQLVLAGDVALLENGSKARVSSQSSGSTEYFVVNGECQCKDFSNKAPNGFCKHRLAYGIYKRAYALAKHRLEAQAESTHPEPVSPEADPAEVVSTSTAHIPAQFLTEIHGKQFVQYAGLLAMAHERGLVNLSAHFITVTGDLALAEATAEFADGHTFKECADATPGNVNAKIRPHFPRMALTRAKARALRDALNISMAAVEEMET
jgi:hypothetical protein